MAQMRYRKPSVKTLLGVTKWKKRAKKALGINVVLKPFRLVGNYQRRVLRRAGYYRPEMKMMRAMQRGQVAGPIGPLQVGEKAGDHQHDPNNASLLMAAALAQHEQKQGHGQKQEDDGPGLAGAMLLAASLSGSKKDQHKAPEGHAHQQAAHKEEHHHVPAPHHPAEETPAHKSGRAAQKKPRRRGLRLWGLVVTVLLVALAIVSIWYFWLA